MEGMDSFKVIQDLSDDNVVYLNVLFKNMTLNTFKLNQFITIRANNMYLGSRYIDVNYWDIYGGKGVMKINVIKSEEVDGQKYYWHLGGVFIISLLIMWCIGLVVKR